MMTTPRKFAVAVLVIVFSLPLAAQQWSQLGPDGGDVRKLTRDPHQPERVLLTTSAGAIYESLNHGQKWSRFGHLGTGNDFVLDSVIFHPTRPGTIYVAAWSIERNDAGEVFRSTDNGRTWKTLKDMHGKSIRALSMAPSNPQIMVAGALDGVFRTMDGGEHWSLISPPDHVDIRNIESIAIDPVNPEIIYAGTWHLPWKTTDGGLTWKNIKQGVIDDSDVFSIIIDPKMPTTVYASACSGIYKSENAGESFRKAQGIPFSARRTRVLMQDPVNSDVVYAGTTEGLWKTADAGKTWSRITPANIIVNDVLVNPANANHVMIATDRSGVMVSSDAAQSFTASNRGFAHRQVAAVLADRNHPTTIYAGLINDKEFGGVFVSRNHGQTWQQMSAGLNGLDVFTLRQTAKGDLIAGTNKGIFSYRLGTADYRWKALQVIDSQSIAPRSVKAKGKNAKAVPAKRASGVLASRVFDIEFAADNKWFAATSSGLFASTDEGKSWHGGIVEGVGEFISVHSSGQTVAAASRRALIISRDGGNTWKKTALPANVTTLSEITFDGDSALYLASREGAYRSADFAAHWEYLYGLPVNNVASIMFDAESRRLLVTSTSSTDMFVSTNGGKQWSRSNTGWVLRSVRIAGNRLIATTAFDGIVVEPSASDANRAAGGGGR
jgi:photosystem II stability/assembly factor-like uncharacterized protein